MFKYAQLNVGNVVEAISYLKDEVDANDMILINELEVKLGSTYNRTTGEFTPPEPQPEPEPTPTIEQRLEVIEMTSAHTQLQVDYVAFLTEILAMPQ